jgi:Methyltransferase small domain
VSSARDRRPAPPAAPDRPTAAALRASLESAGYTVERIEEELGVGEFSGHPAEAAVHLRRLGTDDAFATLARLFLLGAVVPEGDAGEVLPVAQVERLGLLERDGASLRATVRLVPHGDYFVASDRAGSGPVEAADWVPGIQAPSVTLAKLAVRLKVVRALDLGTGCGIQALLAAKHTDRVVATDVSPRALAFAAFNAALNGVDNVELRRGDLLEPVRGERFGLVVANPPYVISPDSSYLYRDCGLEADELCRRLVRSVPALLAEGGFAHLLVAWAHDPDGDPVAPLREWVRDCECDAWLLHYRSDDPLTHSASWLAPLATGPAADYEAALDRWLAYLGGLGIAAVGYGAVVFRRRSGGRNWVKVDELPLERLEPASDHTLRVFAAEDRFAEPGGEVGLLAERLALVPTHMVEQQLVCRDGRYDLESHTLVLTDGLGFRAGLDRNTALLLPHLRPDRTLEQALVAAAEDLGVDEADRPRYVAAALPVVRRLLELGFLASASSR